MIHKSLLDSLIDMVIVVGLIVVSLIVVGLIVVKVPFKSWFIVVGFPPNHSASLGDPKMVRLPRFRMILEVGLV